MNRWLKLSFLLCLIPLMGCNSADQTAGGNRASQLSPTDRALQELTLGTTLEQEGKYDEAEKHLVIALKLDESSGLAHNNLGKIYYKQNRFYDAARQFEAAIKLLPEFPEPHNNLGLILEAGQKFDEAIAEYQRADELAPDNPEFLGNLVRAHIRRGDRDENTHQMLLILLARETRPEWRAWIQRELATRFP